MREIVNIHVGQAGVRMGHACWELFCREHNIQLDGTVSENGFQELSADNTMYSSFFSGDSKGNYRPRSLFVDLEPSIIDEIRIGSHRNLFDSQCFLSEKEDASNVFYIGAYTAGASVKEDALNKIRRLTENCDNPGGFIFTHSISGGTGSGLGQSLKLIIHIKYQSKALHFSPPLKILILS